MKIGIIVVFIAFILCLKYVNYKHQEVETKNMFDFARNVKQTFNKEYYFL